MKSIVSATLVAMLVLCAGCASVTQGTTHSLRIETVTRKGEQVAGADCSLVNDQGTTIAKSGTSTIVRRSSKDLEVTCAAAGQPDAKARLISRANVGLAGNIILGGAIGAVIDHNTGAAYTYPTWVRMVFGQFNVFDRREEHEGVAMIPPDAPAAQATQPPVAAAPPPAVPAQPPVAAAPPQGPFVRVPVALAPSPARQPIAAGDSFDYRVTDRQTGRQQTVVLRAERVRAGEVSFNGGSRVESPDGRVRIASQLVGELDQVTPPQGWMPEGRLPSGSWKMRYASIVPGSGMSYDLAALVEGEQKMMVDGREVRAVRIALEGWAESRVGLLPSRARYQGVAWVSPEIGRVVRYEARSRSQGNAGGAGFSIDEVAELVRMGRD